MNLNQLGKLHVSEKMRKRISSYLALTGNDPEKASNPEDQQFFLGILEAFGNDPEKAAQRYNSVCQKADRARLQHFEQSLHKAPNPQQKNFFLRFDCAQDAHNYREKAKEEARRIAYRIIEQEFYHIVQVYHATQARKSHSVQ